MDYTNLKRGDVIVMGINPKYSDDSDERIVIINRIESNVVYEYKLYTYAELDISVNDLFLEKEEPGYSYKVDVDITDYYTFRLATVEEKTKLYNAIGKHFTEEYDKNWYNHFTDSSYFDIQDYLLDIFCIKVDEYDDDLIYPDFINDIHQFIWDGCCKAMDNIPTNTVVKNKKPQEKMVSLEQVCEWLKNTIDDDVLVKCGSVIKCMDVDDFVLYFRKAMAE